MQGGRERPVALQPRALPSAPIKTAVRPLRMVPADQCATQLEERLVDIGPPLVAHLQPPIAGEPRQRPLDRPPMPTQPFAGLDAAPGDARGYAPLPERLAAPGKSCPVSACSFFGRLRGRPRGLRIGQMVSTSSSSALESWTLAAVWIAASGTPFRSTTRWRLEPDLPLSVGFGPVFSPPGGGHARRVQRSSLPVNLVCLAKTVQERSSEPVPHPGLVPLLEPAPAGHAGATAHLLGQHLPGDAALKYEQDARKRRSVVDARAAALRLGRPPRQEWCYDCPQFVANQWFRHECIVPD